jgi:hypothetical protein
VREGGLGRRRPSDFGHVERYPLTAVQAVTVAYVERTLSLPLYHVHYDQGEEGACVGFSCSWMMSIQNRKRYAPHWLYEEAQKVDEWDDTPPMEGTSVRAAFDILRRVGHRRMWGRYMQPTFLAHGIASNRWARTVDEIRTSIADGTSGVLGINWYQNFDTPLGRVEGGHAICYHRASDRRQAIGLVNTWGMRYPVVWIPYEVVQRLIDEDGEAGVIVDRA